MFNMHSMDSMTSNWSQNKLSSVNKKDKKLRYSTVLQNCFHLKICSYYQILVSVYLQFHTQFGSYIFQFLSLVSFLFWKPMFRVKAEWNKYYFIYLLKDLVILCSIYFLKRLSRILSIFAYIYIYSFYSFIFVSIFCLSDCSFVFMHSRLFFFFKVFTNYPYIISWSRSHVFFSDLLLSSCTILFLGRATFWLTTPY